MLASLHIENIAVIKSLDIDFGKSFCVLSGETGAGKSIIIDSINLLIGNKFGRELIRSGESECSVSAVFDEIGERAAHEIEEIGFPIPDRSIMIKKSVGADGKSSVKFNGMTVTAAIQKKICAKLINIHGQNDNQSLLQKQSHVGIIDEYAQNGEMLSEYAEVYLKLRDAEKKLESITKNESERLRLVEMLGYQIKDIESAKLKKGEEEALIAERDKVANIEKITKQSDFVYRALLDSEKSASVLVSKSEEALGKLASYIPEASELAKRLENIRYEIEDIAESAHGFAGDEYKNPTEYLDRIESRLEQISRLEKKYGAGVDEVLAYRDECKKKLEEAGKADEISAELEDEIKEYRAKAYAIADRISESRKTASREIEKRVKEELSFLDMPKIRFEVSIAKSDDLLPDGYDDCEFLLSANPGEPLLPLVRIASGGELARIMLALRSVLSKAGGVGTVIFDEVDTGISGKTSRKVGIKLLETANDSHSQIICVTHSAQIASLADSHYLISKNEVNGRSETSVRELDPAGRIDEIARILGGISVTDIQRKAAKEMIEERESILKNEK